MTLRARAGGGSVPGPAARGLALPFSRRTSLGLPETGLLALARAASHGDQRPVSMPELDWGENLSCGGVCRDMLIPKSPVQRGCSRVLSKLLPLSPNRPTPVCISIRRAGGCERTRTAQGRGRCFLRLALQGKVLVAAVRQLAQTPRLLEVRHMGGADTHGRWAVKRRGNLCYFIGFQFYDPGSSILGSEDLRGKMVAHPKQDAACVVVLHCCRGKGRVHCDFSNPNLALESKYVAAVMFKKKKKCKYLNRV